ncbi:class V aminotransferase [Blastomonas aquatica]|uniref:Class V aminotransferase n=2 Tax=Blastomonas aquatica TaxID=1510276 RepID=A0ABQ1J854_9SPHN|nr:class V aminotransferase [Blastomonas aquatica]
MTENLLANDALDRRGFMGSVGAAVLAAGVVSACDRGDGESGTADAPTSNRRNGPHPPKLTGSADWEDVRAQFDLSEDTIHMSAMLISSHPKPVREAIERHRKGLDRDPVTYLEANNSSGLNAARSAAGNFLGVGSGRIALTDSTTMGVGMVYNGMQLAPEDEILSTEQDYYVTIEAIRQLSKRTGARVRRIVLYERTETLSPDEAVARILAGINPRTRVVALTWVHSSTGYKLPAGAIGDAIEKINSSRPQERRIVFALDGVHGFGVEDVELSDLRCDYLMAGCHKWLFGPRGTGIIVAGEQGYAPLIPSIPSFLESGAFTSWVTDNGDAGPNNAQRMTPGGFQAFEHKWALLDAFEWIQSIGKSRVAARTYELAGQLKEGLRSIDAVTVQTPASSRESAGIVAFDIEGLSPNAAVARLRERKIIASVAPYAIPHVRLTPSIRNTPAEIDEVLRVIRQMA